MPKQGSYPMGSRTLANGDTLTGVVTGGTADVPVETMREFVVSTSELNPDNETAPGSLDGNETWSIRKAGAWAKTSLSAIASFVLSVYAITIGSATGLIARTIVAEILDLPVSVKRFGVKGDGITIDTLALKNAVASGYSALFFPRDMLILQDDTIVITTEQRWFAGGPVTFKNAQANGAAIKPMLDAKAKWTHTPGFTWDHNAQSGNYTPNTVYGGNPIAGSAILLQGDDSYMNRPTVNNAWDNGIAIVKINTSTNLAVPGYPRGFVIDNPRTSSCGVGVHTGTTPGKIGAGVDNASGIGVIKGAIDFYSYVSFINDIGAGARGVWSDCIGYYPQLDASNPSNGSGYGLYSGSPDSDFTNIQIIGAGFRSYWFDAPAINCRYANMFSDAPQKEAFWIKSPKATLTACTAKNTGQAAANTYDDFLLDSSAGAITELSIVTPQTLGGTSRYSVTATGGNSIKAQIIHPSFSSATAATNLGAYTVGLIYWDRATGNRWGINRSTPGFPFDVYGRGRFSAEQANAGWNTSVFGDSSANGTFFVEDFATPAKRAAFGYDPANDCFVAQAIQAGVAKKPFLVNPSGGNVGLTTGRWNTGCVTIGSYYLWIDSSGRLRIKNGAPTSDTDGTVVGTQS